MSHNRKLGKPTDQRIAMLRAMTTYLLENGQIKTTVSRAKEVAPMAEKMITLAKNANLANYRKALSYLTKEDVAKKLFDEIGPKYATRNGGAFFRLWEAGQEKSTFPLHFAGSCAILHTNKSKGDGEPSWTNLRLVAST